MKRTISESSGMYVYHGPRPISLLLMQFIAAVIRKTRIIHLVNSRVFLRKCRQLYQQL